MSNLQIKTEFGGFPDASVIGTEDSVIVCAGAYPIKTSFTISYEEAAEFAQMLMDAVSDHVQKAAA